MEGTRVCDICGVEHPISELLEFGDVLLCAECLRTETVVCERCGTRIWNDDNEGDSESEGISPEEIEEYLYCG